jgi:hypothetical protein
MTDDIKAKVLALLNKMEEDNGSARRYTRLGDSRMEEALCRAIEQHEATKKERNDLGAALVATAAACADHVNTILQLRSELAAFKQGVSDAVGHVLMNLGARHWAQNHLNTLIIPKPKPDPLVEVLESLYLDTSRVPEIRAALDAAGLEIREKGK